MKTLNVPPLNPPTVDRWLDTRHRQNEYCHMTDCTHYNCESCIFGAVNQEAFLDWEINGDMLSFKAGSYTHDVLTMSDPLDADIVSVVRRAALDYLLNEADNATDQETECIYRHAFRALREENMDPR